MIRVPIGYRRLVLSEANMSELPFGIEVVLLLMFTGGVTQGDHRRIYIWTSSQQFCLSNIIGARAEGFAAAGLWGTARGTIDLASQGSRTDADADPGSCYHARLVRQVAATVSNDHCLLVRRCMVSCSKAGLDLWGENPTILSSHIPSTIVDDLRLHKKQIPIIEIVTTTVLMLKAISGSAGDARHLGSVGTRIPLLRLNLSTTPNSLIGTVCCVLNLLQVGPRPTHSPPHRYGSFCRRSGLRQSQIRHLFCSVLTRWRRGTKGSSSCREQ
ncbi:hypothetical protein Ancab_030272, partial [Ancistrocladus abbreviatus]